jgi:hypothetical protein
MKKNVFNLILVLACSFSLSLKAQGGIELGVHAEQSFFGNRQQQSYGFNLYLPVGDIFTVDWQLGIGPRTKGGFYSHTPGGIVPGAFILSQFGGVERRFWNVTGLLLMILPEGMGVYANQEGRFRHHFAIHPLGFDYWYRRNPYDEVGKLTGTIQYRLKVVPNEERGLFISPTVGAAMVYNPDSRIDRWGLRVGITIGYSESW